METHINVESKYNKRFVFPALIFLLIFAVFPLLYVAVFSLLRYAMNRPYEPITFIGGGNYVSLFKEARFLSSITKTTIYMIVTTFGSILLGFVMAYLIWTMKDGIVKSVLRVLWAIPVFCAPVIIGHGFRYMYQIGPLNTILSKIGIISSSPLGEYPDALIAIMLTEIWYWAPFCYMILLSGLYSVPPNRLEASSTDGAWALERLWHTILPAIKYYFVVILLIRLMDSWKAYDFINSITKGGPGYSTEALSKYAYMNAFTWWNMGKASAIGIFMLFITITITWLFVNIGPIRQRLREKGLFRDKKQPQESKELKPLFDFNSRSTRNSIEVTSVPKTFRDQIREVRKNKAIKRKIYGIILLIFDVFLTIVILFPYFFIIRSGFMTNQDALSIPIKWNFIPTLENFHFVLFENSVIPYLLTTLLIACSVTILTLLLAVPAAYALSRYKWKFNQTIFFFILTTRMAAPVVFGLPLYMLAIMFNILDTYLIMIIAYLLMNLGFSIWILKGFFDGIPRDLDETAYLQGTSKLKAFLNIDLPLAKKGIAVAAIFTFIFTWNDSFYATLLGGSNIKTISVLLPSYFIHHIPQWSVLSAAGTIYILPSVIFAIVIFRLIQHGLKLNIS